LKAKKVRCSTLTYYDKILLPRFHGLLEELNSLNLEWFQPSNPHSAQQICLNAAPGYTDDYSFGAGYFADKGKSDFFIRLTPQGDIRIPMSPKSVYDWELCDVFKDTVFESVYRAMETEYEIGRVRLLKSKPYTCMNWHIDPIPRLHYPIQTDEACLMIIEDEVKHLPLEHWTFAHTDKGNHTALNASDIDRIHLVADILP
jgi:hypothetical protein